MTAPSSLRGDAEQIWRAAIGAVNTLIFEPGGEVVGDNTDAPGFIASLPESPAPGSTSRLFLPTKTMFLEATAWPKHVLS